MANRKYGVVYTPERLADFTAELLHREMNEVKAEKILDPACGECALLKAAKNIFGLKTDYIGIDIDSEPYESLKEEYPILLNDSILPHNVKGLVSKYWRKKIGKITAIIANPPWSSEKIYDREKLSSAGFTLVSGQYDSFVLFIELAYNILEDGGYFAFIIPDSLFDAQNENLRKFLSLKTEIKVIARLGEKIFDEVNRSTSVIICKKCIPNKENITHCFRLNTESRKKYLSSNLPLIKFYDQFHHDVKQSRFLDNDACNFDIDTHSNEEILISKIKKDTIKWDQYFMFGRGVEISKSGNIVYCESCGCAQGFKKIQKIERKKLCTHCGKEIDITDKTIKKVVSKNKVGNKVQLFVGENIRRYEISGEFYIELNVPGINYKNLKMYTPPKLLIRKTGLGIYASIDYTGSMTSQTVYILKPKNNVPNIPLEYYLALLNSRVVYYYYLKTYGENEWKSHPYLTKQIIFSLPIKKYEGNELDNQIVSLASELAQKYTYEKDVQLEKLIIKKYSISPDEEKMVYEEMNNLPNLSAINDMKIEVTNYNV